MKQFSNINLTNDFFIDCDKLSLFIEKEKNKERAYSMAINVNKHFDSVFGDYYVSHSFGHGTYPKSYERAFRIPEPYVVSGGKVSPR